MSATLNPNSYLPGIKKFTSQANGSASAAVLANSTDYFAIPLSALPGLAFADTDPTTGDIREIIYALEIQLLASYTALSAGNRPVTWVPRVTTQGFTNNTVSQIYSNTFDITFTGETLTPE